MIVADDQARDERAVGHRMLRDGLRLDRVVQQRSREAESPRFGPDRLRLELLSR